VLGFNRIILSRKGFDSSAGGDYSPFDPDTGKYIVLPIPIDDKEACISNRLEYEAIRIKKNYLPDYSDINLKSLMETMGKKAIIKGKESQRAHFDPWLGRCPWLSKDSDHHIGAFGQVDGPQTTLMNNYVGKGSLFLFFSRFKPINWTKVSRFNDIDIRPEHLKEGVYFIYGWLRVGGEPIKCYDEIDSKINDPELKRELKERHPHAKAEYFEKYEKKKGKNTIYIADIYLFDNSKEYSGCGYFHELSENLLLTATESAQKSRIGNWIPSRWKMPPGFSSEQCCSYLKRRYTKDGLAETAGRGQEFVFKESDEFCQWFKDKLLPEMRKQNRTPRCRNTWS
jgi:hypothetical protein